MNILIATPVRASDPFTAQIHVGYAETLRKLMLRMPSTGIIPSSIAYGTDNVRARNRIAAVALQQLPYYDGVLWWDDDQWPEDVSLAEGLLATGEDVIGAAYTTKGSAVRLPRLVYNMFTGDVSTCAVHEVHSIGFGFTYTSMSCLRRMNEVCERYLDDDPELGMVANMFGMLYDTKDTRDSSSPRVLLSEDYSFCKRWRDACGGRVMVYHGGIIVHAGPMGWTARHLPR